MVLPTDLKEEVEEEGQADSPMRPPRSSGTFGFVGTMGEDELTFEQLGVHREDSLGVSRESLAEAEKGTEDVAPPVVLVDAVEKLLDSTFEPENQASSPLQLPYGSVESLGDREETSPATAARPPSPPPLVPLLSTTPPPTSFFPRTLNHQPSNLTIFLTPLNSPSPSFASTTNQINRSVDALALIQLEGGRELGSVEERRSQEVSDPNVTRNGEEEGEASWL